uniref:SXP/RAL-2 family protein Ani s 5-like cation-binding domain-containing protein n=1 Tax=Ascaris lumbricoides TaxID=6252 RepID=A0A0M3I2B6_ASCLU
MIGINILLPMIVLKMNSAQLIGSTFPSPQVSELPITYTSGEGAIPSSMAALGTYNFKQNPDIPCGLPPFVDKLSPLLQQRLRDVWKFYKQGDECGAQQAQTFTIVRTLNEQERANIFGQPPSIQNLRPQSIIPELVPMFIRTSSPEVRRKFDTIWGNETLSVEERCDEMEKLANQFLNAQQLTDFTKWIESVRAQKAQLDARINALSIEARNAYHDLKALRAKEQTIMRSISPATANELIGLI